MNDDRAVQITIRRYQHSDYDTVTSVWKKAALRYRPKGRDSRENITRQVDSGQSSLLLAEANGIVVGTVLASSDGRRGFINRLAVIPDYWGRGVAGRLVSEAERLLTVLGLEIIVALVEAGNSNSMRVFEKLAYVKEPDIVFVKRKSRDA